MRKATLLTFFAFCFLGSVDAQQDPMFTKYMFNSLAYNPAYAGSHEYMSVRLLYRNQWWNQSGGPETQTFTIHSPMNEKIGLGLSLINDKIGVTGSTTANLSYAYRLLLGPGKLSLGLQAGITNWRADWNELKYRDPREVDIAFTDIDEKQWLPNFGAGVFYYSKLWYAGFSVPKLLQNDLRNGGNEVDVTESAKLYRHYYISAGAAIPLSGDDLIFKPSFLIKNVGLFGVFGSDGSNLFQVGAPTEFDIDASLLFFQTLWVGLSYRSAIEGVTGDLSSTDSMDVWASFQLDNGFRIGGAYDHTLTKLKDYVGGTFELMLGYDFNYNIKKMNTPRYF